MDFLLTLSGPRHAAMMGGCYDVRGKQGDAVDKVLTVPRPIHYPETDGKPMGETDVHIDALIYLREALRDYFRDAPQVYVAGNMFLYYEEGNPTACVAPDVFVVQGVDKHERRTYRLWEESQPPAVVFEITSRETRLEDLGTKRAVYAMLGVQEYFVYDPLGEYLRPPLQGYRLHEGEYQRLPPAGEEGLTSQVLGLALRVEAGRLRVVDLATGERLLTPAEVYAARRTETTASRAAEVEAELERLRAELVRLRGEA
jgi:Uma2 family endonuclease